MNRRPCFSVMLGAYFREHQFYPRQSSKAASSRFKGPCLIPFIIRYRGKTFFPKPSLGLHQKAGPISRSPGPLIARLFPTAPLHAFIPLKDGHLGHHVQNLFTQDPHVVSAYPRNLSISRGASPHYSTFDIPLAPRRHSSRCRQGSCHYATSELACIFCRVRGKAKPKRSLWHPAIPWVHIRAGKMSNTTDAPGEQWPMSPSLRVLSFCFLLLIMALSLFGNTLVILAFKNFTKLRTVTNYFVVSLAVADILVTVASMPIWAANMISNLGLSEFVTKLWTWMDILCGVASILHLTAISIERYICISYPLTYHTAMTGGKARLVMLLMWTFSVVMASLKLVLWDRDPPLYELIIVISSFFIPLLIMCVAYYLIFKVARYQARQIALTINGSVKNFFLASELRAAKTLAVVMGAFVICWGPFFVLNLVYGFCEPCITYDAVLVAKWMHYSNSVFNPIVYTCRNREFRSAFINILAGKKCLRKFRSRSAGSDMQTEQAELTVLHWPPAGRAANLLEDKEGRFSHVFQ